MTKPTTSATTGAGEALLTAALPGLTPEAQAFVRVDADGHLVGSRPDFLIWFAPTANAANKIIGDVFNTGAVPIRIRGLWMIPNMAAITGVPIDWIVGRTTAAGTGGAAVTPAPMDTTVGTWPAAATARSAPTAGATAGTVLFNIYTETKPACASHPAIGTQQHRAADDQLTRARKRNDRAKPANLKRRRIANQQRAGRRERPICPNDGTRPDNRRASAAKSSLSAQDGALPYLGSARPAERLGGD